MISSKKPSDVFNHGSCDLKQVAFYAIFKGNSMLLSAAYCILWSNICKVNRILYTSYQVMIIEP